MPSAHHNPTETPHAPPVFLGRPPLLSQPRSALLFIRTAMPCTHSRDVSATPVSALRPSCLTFSASQVAPRSDIIALRDEYIAPQRDFIALHGDFIVFRNDFIPLHVDSVALQPDFVALRVDSVALHAEYIALYADSSALHAYGIALRAYTIALRLCFPTAIALFSQIAGFASSPMPFSPSPQRSPAHSAAILCGEQVRLRPPASLTEPLGPQALETKSAPAAEQSLVPVLVPQKD